MDYLQKIQAAVTVSDSAGIIRYMNDRSAEVFKADGGTTLIGTSLFECHPEPAQTKLKHLLEHQLTNTYTIEKNGKKKLIFQTPCDGGMMEISIELPEKMEHFIRA